MTIQEFIEALNDVPQNRRDEELQVYVQGPISGFLDTSRLDLDPDRNYISIRCDLTEQK